MSFSGFTFNSSSHQSLDPALQAQNELQNAYFADHNLENLWLGASKRDYITFATSQPSIMPTGKAHGNGLDGSLVDAETRLVFPKWGDREADKLQLVPRPFLTVPYLGKGSCDPVFESRLLQGDLVGERKSVSTMSEQTLLGYILPPEPVSCSEANTVDELAFKGWTRGGDSARAAAVL